MSQIAVVWRVVGPMLLGHPMLTVIRAWIMAALRLIVAFGAAVGVYGLAMLVVVELYPSDRPLAWLVYGAGLGVAAWFGTCAGALAARAGQQRLVANGAAGLALVTAVGLAFDGGMTGPGQGIYLFYVSVSGVGGIGAVRLLSALPTSRGTANVAVARTRGSGAPRHPAT